LPAQKYIEKYATCRTPAANTGVFLAYNLQGVIAYRALYFSKLLVEILAAVKISETITDDAN